MLFGPPVPGAKGEGEGDDPGPRRTTGVWLEWIVWRKREWRKSGKQQTETAKGEM